MSEQHSRISTVFALAIRSYTIGSSWLVDEGDDFFSPDNTQNFYDGLPRADNRRRELIEECCGGPTSVNEVLADGRKDR